MEKIEVNLPGDSASEPVEQAAERVPVESNNGDSTGLTGESASDPAESDTSPESSMEEVTYESLSMAPEPEGPGVAETDLRAVIEAIIYVTEEPLTAAQIAAGLNQSEEQIRAVLARLAEDCARAERGITIREVAGGYRMATKPEHHEAVRAFVKSLKPPLKLSLAALETLAVIAYKQPITAPEIMEIRGVQGAGVLKTLIDRKLIATAGRKQVVGKPILYKTTKEFLLQFGLKDLAELPTLKEFEELRRLAWADTDIPASEPAPGAETEAGTEAGTEAETEAEKKGPEVTGEEPPAQNVASD